MEVLTIDKTFKKLLFSRAHICPKYNRSLFVHPNSYFRFKKQVVQECIQNIQAEVLHEQEYANEEVSEWVEKISNQVKEKIKSGLQRYFKGLLVGL